MVLVGVEFVIEVERGADVVAPDEPAIDEEDEVRVF